MDIPTIKIRQLLKRNLFLEFKNFSQDICLIVLFVVSTDSMLSIRFIELLAP